MPVDDETIPEPSASKPKAAKGKGKAADSVAIADLSEDDFALMGSDEDDEDDDLSIMSGFDGDGGLDISDDLLSDSDDDEDDLSDSEAEGDEWAGIGDDESVDSSSSSPSTPADAVDPEDAYSSRKRRRLDVGHANKPAPPKKLPIKLPDGQLVTHPHDIEAPVAAAPASRVTFAESSSGSSGSESEDEVELARRKKAAQPKKSDPLGRRFGRPAVRAILETADPEERLAMAKEELATLGRDVVAEPETSVRQSERVSDMRCFPPSRKRRYSPSTID